MVEGGGGSIPLWFSIFNPLTCRRKATVNESQTNHVLCACVCFQDGKRRLVGLGLELNRRGGAWWSSRDAVMVTGLARTRRAAAGDGRR